MQIGQQLLCISKQKHYREGSNPDPPAFVVNFASSVCLLSAGRRYIRLKGFTVDGAHDDEYEADSFVNKCVEVRGRGQNEMEALEGFVMTGVTVRNCG